MLNSGDSTSFLPNHKEFPDFENQDTRQNFEQYFEGVFRNAFCVIFSLVQSVDQISACWESMARKPLLARDMKKKLSLTS
jgi:hypothetical protein